MPIAQQIQNDLKDALKSRDSVRADTLRMVKSAIKNREIEAGGELDDDGIQKIIKSMIKQRRESVDAYRDGGRDELADRESREVDLLQAYLPPEIGDEQIEAACDAAIAAAGDTPQYGPVMGAVMKSLQGNVDGKRVAEILRSKLND